MNSYRHHLLVCLSGIALVASCGSEVASITSMPLRSQDVGLCRPTWSEASLPDPVACSIIEAGRVVGSLGHDDPSYQGSPAQSFCMCLDVGDVVALETSRVPGLSVQDTVLTLLDNAGEVVAEDDDSGERLQARISEYVVQTPGAHMIVVAAHAPRDDIGNFLLRVAVAPPVE